MSERDVQPHVRHLLRRFGLGASDAELTAYGSDSYEAAVDRLLSFSDAPDPAVFDVERLITPKGRLAPGAVGTWWVSRMLTTPQPLQERMTLFWHNHFATSGEKVGAGPLLHRQNEILRKNCLGSFRTLLTETSKDPAMILWLDNQQNVNGHANENFAREVMELFTLGIGHYTEADVKEGARAFTGWSIRRDPDSKGDASFTARPFRHDNGSKSFLGSQGNFNGDDILNILCDQPQAANYVTTRLWDWFVWPKPTPNTIAPFAERFRKSGLDVKALLRDIMLSREFSSRQAQESIVKDPVSVCVTMMRQMGVGDRLRSRLSTLPPDGPIRQATAPAAIAYQSMKTMGMWLLYPPDVHGWDNGNAWITSQTMVSRMEWADRLFGKGTGLGPMRYSAYDIFQASPTPAAAVQALTKLFDASIKPAHARVLVEAAEKACGSAVTAQNANAVADSVTRLMLACPEYQLS